MADTKISALPASTTPLTGTELVPVVQGGVTKKVSVDNLTQGKIVYAATYVASTSANIGPGGTSTGLGVLYLNGGSGGGGGFIQGQQNSSPTWLIGDTTTALGSGTGLIEYIYGGQPKITYIAGTGEICRTTTTGIVPASGKGVNFTANTPAAGMTSQLLNWYEEGAYTATMSPTTSGTITLAGTHNTLTYTRVGRMVTVVGMLMVDSVSSPVGAININLPFTAKSGNSANSAVALFVNGSNGPLSADFIGFISAGTSTLTIYLGDGNFVQSDSADAMQANTQVTISATYFV